MNVDAAILDELRRIRELLERGPGATSTSTSAAPFVSEADVAAAAGCSTRTVRRRLPWLPAPDHTTGTDRLVRWWRSAELDELVAVVRMRQPTVTPAAPRKRRQALRRARSVLEHVRQGGE